VDIDYFFYYGKVDQRDEIEADLLQGLTQAKRSMFYYRGFGAGVPGYENYPQGLSLQISLKFDVASWIARRNLEVSDGTNGKRDRRAVTSQNAIAIIQGENGVDINVLYIPYFDYEKPAMVTVPVGK